MTHKIADALAGTRGPITLAMRYELHDLQAHVIRDITSAVSGGRFEVDIFAEVPSRVSGIIINEKRLEQPIDFKHDFLAPIVHLGYDDHTTVAWQVGLFTFGRPTLRLGAETKTWGVDAGDMCERLASFRTQNAYRVRTNQNIYQAVAYLCDQAGLRVIMEGAEHATAQQYTWPPGTSYLRIMNDLALIAGCYPFWADRDGTPHTRRVDISVTTSESRTFEEGSPAGTQFFNTVQPIGNANVNWTGPDALAEYRTDREPRLLREPLSGSINPEDRANVVIAEGINLHHVVVGNADRRGNLYPAKVGNERTLDLHMSAAENVLLDHAGWQLVLAEARAAEYTISTAIDPRPEGRPYYRLGIDGFSDNELWMSMGWSFDLGLAGEMTHRIGRLIRDLEMAAYTVTEFTAGQDFINE